MSVQYDLLHILYEANGKSTLKIHGYKSKAEAERERGKLAKEYKLQNYTVSRIQTVKEDSVGQISLQE